MKKFLFVAVLVALVVGLALMAQTAMASGCTNSALIGDYMDTTVSNSWIGQSATQCVTFVKKGVVTITGGWVFDRVTISISGTTPITLTTYSKQGEAAPQLSPYTFTVEAGAVVAFQVIADAPHLTELGLRLSYRAPVSVVYSLYLPFVSKASQTPLMLEVVQNIADNRSLQLFQADFQGAQPNQLACLKLVAPRYGASVLADIESGWFFGETITGKFAGGSFVVPSHVDASQQAKQIDAFAVGLGVENFFSVCTNSATGGSRQIGLRLRFQ